MNAIETAPKDRTILLWVSYPAMQEGGAWVLGYWLDGKNEAAFQSGWMESGGYRRRYPNGKPAIYTHWADLPEAPK